MAIEKSPSKVEKPHTKKSSSSRPASEAFSEADTMATTATPGASDRETPSSGSPNDSASSQFQPPPWVQPFLRESTSSYGDTVETTNSSPTDFSYTPNESGTGGRLANRTPPLKATPMLPVLPNGAAEKSFFDFDTESEEDEPVVGRASSVRMSKPNVVEETPTLQEQSGHMLGVNPDKKNGNPSTMGARSSEASGTTITQNEDSTEQVHGSPADALKILNGRDKGKDLPTQTPGSQPVNISSDLAEQAKRGGLHMNPLTPKDHSSIQKTNSAPPLPLRSSSLKRVRIRPSDLVVNHSKENLRPFRESVVTTPYPVLDERDEKAAEDEADENDNVTALSMSAGTSKSTGSAKYRLTLPDGPETIFVKLGLVNHPSAVTKIEIKMVDKNTYDDEMLFGQIRSAYRKELLGRSRCVLQLIRGVSYASVVPSKPHLGFKATEFLRHLEDPSIGRNQKWWISWLYHHSDTYISPPSDFSKQPLSGSLRTADKRSSVQSDSHSTVDFSSETSSMFRRIASLNRKAFVEPLSPSTWGMQSTVPEGTDGIIKINLHHEFSFWAIAFLALWIISWSIAAVVFWTIFGVPGFGPEDKSPMAAGTALSSMTAWHSAAQARVLTGLVLGMLVALLGSMVELCLVAGAYILL